MVDGLNMKGPLFAVFVYQLLIPDIFLLIASRLQWPRLRNPNTTSAPTCLPSVRRKSFACWRKKPQSCQNWSRILKQRCGPSNSISEPQCLLLHCHEKYMLLDVLANNVLKMFHILILWQTDSSCLLGWSMVLFRGGLKVGIHPLY